MASPQWTNINSSVAIPSDTKSRSRSGGVFDNMLAGVRRRQDKAEAAALRKDNRTNLLKDRETLRTNNRADLLEQRSYAEGLLVREENKKLAKSEKIIAEDNALAKSLSASLANGSKRINTKGVMSILMKNPKFAKLSESERKEGIDKYVTGAGSNIRLMANVSKEYEGTLRASNRFTEDQIQQRVASDVGRHFNLGDKDSRDFALKVYSFKHKGDSKGSGGGSKRPKIITNTQVEGLVNSLTRENEYFGPDGITPNMLRSMISHLTDNGVTDPAAIGSALRNASGSNGRFKEGFEFDTPEGNKNLVTYGQGRQTAYTSGSGGGSTGVSQGSLDELFGISQMFGTDQNALSDQQVATDLLSSFGITAPQQVAQPQQSRPAPARRQVHTPAPQQGDPVITPQNGGSLEDAFNSMYAPENPSLLHLLPDLASGLPGNTGRSVRARARSVADQVGDTSRSILTNVGNM